MPPRDWVVRFGNTMHVALVFAVIAASIACSKHVRKEELAAREGNGGAGCVHTGSLGAASSSGDNSHPASKGTAAATWKPNATGASPTKKRRGTIQAQPSDPPDAKQELGPLEVLTVPRVTCRVVTVGR